MLVDLVPESMRNLTLFDEMYGGWKFKSLAQTMDAINAKYSEDVPRPKNWGGYILKATYYEFWQGRQSRLHDRICYTLKGKKWVKQRLAP